MLVVLGSMPMPICNRFHEILANSGKITTFTDVPLFHALVCRFSRTTKSRLGPLKSTFNAENFLRIFSVSISIDQFALEMCFAARNL